MSTDNNALLFIGYPTTELEEVFKAGGDVEEEWLNMKEEVYYMDVTTKLDIKVDDIILQWSSAHEQYLVGVLISDSGTYSFKTIVVKELVDNLIHFQNALALIFRKEPKLYIMNYQW